MRFGCAWYPEHWNKNRWPEDLALMRDAGMNVVRLGEFAWSLLEPEEGRYDFDWLEQAIDLAASLGLDTVVGTPTAAPPAWLTQRYPDTLAVRDHGRPATHGNRCHFSPTSPRYLDFCAKIAEAMAARFGRHPHVIGWQIDNEYNTTSYDETTRQKFQDYLRERYRTLETLNARWTTAYWSQTYQDWSQVPLPIGGHHPGLMLEFRRFLSRVYQEYQRVQIAAIRRHSERWITHNFMGWFDLFDHYLVSRELDFASWDSYVGSGHLDFLGNGSAHDLVRGFRRRTFWLMETQPGNVNWSPLNNALNRGEVRAMAWHAIGHGADAVLYWQWRSALNGQEQYHGSIVGPDGRPRPVYREIRELGRDLGHCRAALTGTELVAECALLHAYDDRWAVSFQRHHRDFDPVGHLNAYYRALRARVPTVDIVHPSAPLEGYRLVIAPHLQIIDQALAARLYEFVSRGGHLVLGARSGMKDDANALLPSRQPGPLAPLLGAHVEEYYALDTPVPLEPEGEAKFWAEWLEPDQMDVEVVLRYGPSNGWLDHRAAVVTRRVVSGQVTYVGGWLDDASLERLTTGWVTSSKLELFPVPTGVEACRRVGPAGEVWILVNHQRSPQTVILPWPARDLISDQFRGQKLELGEYGVAVLVKAEAG
jgi:beta-galactosidase